jgi:uncharacterized membrane protein
VQALWTAVVFLALIGLAAATRRTVVLFSPGTLSNAKSPAAGLDAGFAAHRSLTLAHVLPGMLFMVLGPLQFVRRIRSSYPWLHRWTGRAFLIASLIVGCSALAMSWKMSIGGANETAATTLYGAFFLIALAKAYRYVRRREFVLHRQWMIRAYAIGLAVATIRPIVGGFFGAALARGQQPNPHEFFGTTFWIGFTLHSIAAQAWINYTRPAMQASAA